MQSHISSVETLLNCNVTSYGYGNKSKLYHNFFVQKNRGPKNGILKNNNLMMRFRKRIITSWYYFLVVFVLFYHCVNSQQRQDDVSFKENQQQQQDECWKNEQQQQQQQQCSNKKIIMDPKKKDKKSKQQQIQLAKQFSSLLLTSSPNTNTKNDWKKTLSQWMMYVDMNPDWIGTYIQTNWLEELHTRIMLLAPDAFWNVYRTKPSSDEVSILMSMMTNNGETTREEAFQLHRHRGLVSSLSYTFGSTVIPSIQHWISHATLHEEALKRISRYAPLIEVGAGTAYYSAILQQRGIDIQPYDLYNTTDENHFTNVFYTNVTQASCTQLFPKKESSQQQQQQHFDDYPNYKKTLLIIWYVRTYIHICFHFLVSNPFTTYLKRHYFIN